MTAACNREDREGRCNADDGLPCAECERRTAEEFAHFVGLWRSAALEERDPKKYRAEMIDAGRSRLVSR